MSRTARWSILMTIGGLAVAALVWALTDSIWWALAGLLGSGMVFNMLFGSARQASDRTRLGTARQVRR